MSRGTILLVDDEPHIPLVVGRKLEAAGYTVATAADGEEGLLAALDVHPDLVITDLQMPYKSGIELAASMREDESLRGIPIVLLTARGYVLPAGESDAPNIVRVMAKPFSVHQILEIVDELMGRGRSEAA